MKRIIPILAAAMLVFPSIAARSETNNQTENDLYKSITVSAAGDCTLGTDVNFAYNGFFTAKYDEVQDPSYFLGGMKTLFDNDDLTIVNFEGTLTERGVRQDKTFAFKGKPEYTEILTTGSVEAVNLANNHSVDYGWESYEDTITYLDGAGIVNFGNDRYSIIDVNGIKVGLVGVYELGSGLGSKDKMIPIIKAAKKEGAQLVIVSFHWGIERDYYPNSIQVGLARCAVDNGADLVLGHHPHVLQGIELYKGKYIVYSLGNFCFGGNSNPSDKDTMVFRQTFNFIGDRLVMDDMPTGVLSDSWANPRRDFENVFEELSYDNCEIIPSSVSSVNYANDYRPTILEGEEQKRVQEKIEKLSLPLTSKFNKQ